MAQNLETANTSTRKADPMEPPTLETANAPPPVERLRRPAAPTDAPLRWWRRPWVIPLWAVVAAFLIYELRPYLGLDSSRGRIVLDESFAPHYPMLIGHIGFGTVAMLAVCLQVWPWLRQHHPAIHRASGRVYVFGGVIPSATLVLLISPFAAGGQIGIVVHAILWLTATVIGFRMARQRRYVLHRRWMLRSFALTMGIIWGLATVIVWPYLPFKADLSLLFEMARWFGWVVNLIIVQLWLDRTATRPLKMATRA